MRRSHGEQITMSKHILLAAATRNGHVERSHWGSVAVTDVQGSLLAWCGDPHVYAFSRSTIKPFQAIPFVRDQGPSHFGFSDSELALLCGSHSGEEDGTYVIGVKSLGLGIAIKIADGDLSALYASAVAVLRKIGLVDDGNVSALARWDNPRLRNLRGMDVGQLKAMVHLSRTSR